MVKSSLSQKLPVVDIVVLSWNRIETTLETIESIQSQQGVITQIWIVDQGSQPENLSLLIDRTKHYSNVKIKALSENIGVPGGRNTGIEMGESEYTVSIDNDAIFDSPHALLKVTQLFDSEPDLGAISFRINNFYTGRDDELSWIFPKSLKSSRHQRFTTTRFCGCGHAIRRSAFEKAGGYDADLFFFWEETDLSYRLINAGYWLIYEPEILVLHKCSPEARVRWDNQRFYYLVRNFLYMHLKYNPKKWTVIIPGLGYLIKGFYNGLPWQSLRGIFDSIRMYKKLNYKREECQDFLIFNQRTKDYLYEHETFYRGSLWHRLKTEVFTTLPGSEASQVN